METDECAAGLDTARGEAESLRHALRQKKKVIRAYEALLLQSAAHSAAGEPAGGARVAAFPCAECAKVFGSDEFLSAHTARAHGGDGRVRTSRAGMARDDERAAELSEQARPRPRRVCVCPCLRLSALLCACVRARSHIALAAAARA